MDALIAFLFLPVVLGLLLLMIYIKEKIQQAFPKGYKITKWTIMSLLGTLCVWLIVHFKVYADIAYGFSKVTPVDIAAALSVPMSFGMIFLVVMIVQRKREGK